MSHSPSPPPPLHAYWFYTSSLAIDDPLSPLPIATSTVKQPPRPFSRYDSTALESSYTELIHDTTTKSDERSNVSTPPLKRVDTPKTKTSAVEGHPTFSVGDDKLQMRDEITSSTAPATDSPLQQKSRRSSSPFRSFFSPSSAPSSSSVPDTNQNAVNTTPTRNPFIRSLSLSRASTMPVQNSSASTEHQKQSDMSTRKVLLDSPVEQKEVPVGVQRLHKVLLPSLVMTPIYWSPLHDVSSVVRGTWFYKDTMLPVETEIANRLETGWNEVRAWTEEWDLELASAVEVGREGEEKVRWQLWDKSSISAPNSRPGSAVDDTVTEEMQTPNSEVSKPTPVANPAALNDLASKVKPNEWDWVLFANGKDAYICRDTMLSFGNKRPLAAIRRGKTVGTHVVRGFSEKDWLQLHPPRRRPHNYAPRKRGNSSSMPVRGRSFREKNPRTYSTNTTKQQAPSQVSGEFEAGGNVGGFEQQGGDGLGLEENEEERGKVTDLFLVIHGIGQKLSERVESFHFTHAINSFRRLVNVELRSEAVSPHLRDDVGLMVLPINWRHNLSFEDGIEGNATEGSETKNTYSLDDITPPSIPAVRNLIGDVMLDIPYYLSHHKQKMVKAVINEANRVYRLWCKNNPGFEKEGRVHIIAHSLGTAIAMDILSKQPTHTQYDPNPPPSGSSGWGKRRNRDSGMQDERFEFDTTNIFFCGSPAAFFLLLNRSMLLPRKGRDKPGMRGEDQEPGICGQLGNYGCMAVDNVYNILHYSDPIAYRLNPTVDPEYAETLKTAHVPSTSSTFLDALSFTLRLVAPSMPRLPSNMELETHDFSRESLAEKRLFLLNDNGQLDWYLNLLRPLENQYLNMLGAHSSYWESRDFARLLVVEAGRPIGRQGTVRAMRVQKKRGFFANKH
ncbi:DDHD domain protein [Geopyxis carbonaria]|nr:DDHD domain protein [Geopyxis carbonaria]